MFEGKYNFKPCETSCLNIAVGFALGEYQNERKRVKALYDRDYSTEIETSLNKLFREGKAVMIYENSIPIGFLGVFISDNKDSEGYKTAWGPICDYGIKKGTDRSKVASLLFQHLSESLLSLNVRHYVVNIYAHDEEIIKAFVLNQFGIMSTNEIKDIDATFITEKPDDIIFTEFSKKEIQENKEMLLQLWRNLANHLRKSPTYYYGAEFTNDSYWEHVNANDTRVFAALDLSKRIIGITDTSHDKLCFIWSDTGTLNVGDLYIEPTYRGKLVAQGLLQYASDILMKDKCKRLWVMHGTGNPNALRFWGKYFSGFVYQLTRTIDSRILDLGRYNINKLRGNY
jgi:hypothetical protein